MRNLEWVETAPWTWVALSSDGAFRCSMYHDWSGVTVYADFKPYGDLSEEQVGVYRGSRALAQAYDDCAARPLHTVEEEA